MSAIRKILSSLVSVRDSVDDALLVAGLAQAGEPELARRHHLDARRNADCCGALSDGEDCDRDRDARCVPAHRRAG